MLTFSGSLADSDIMLKFWKQAQKNCQVNINETLTWGLYTKFIIKRANVRLWIILKGGLFPMEML